MRALPGLTLAIAVLILLGCTPKSASISEGTTVGKQLPHAEFTTGRGERVSVADLRGSPAVINFWATWCGPCREEIPTLQAAHASYGAAGVAFLAVTDELPMTVRPFMDEIGMTLPVWYDPGGKAGKAYGIQSIPQTFFLDAEGRIVARHVGALTREMIDAYLARLLGDAAPSTPEQKLPTPLPSPVDGQERVGWLQRREW